MPKIGIFPQPEKKPDSIRRWQCPKCGMLQMVAKYCRGNDCNYLGPLTKVQK